MLKSGICPEFDGRNAVHILKLFMDCYDFKSKALDVSSAIVGWRHENFTLASKSDYAFVAKAGMAEPFDTFIDVLSENYGRDNIEEPPRCSGAGWFHQSKMHYVRSTPKPEKPRNHAFNKKDNQLEYLAVAL